MTNPHFIEAMKRRINLLQRIRLARRSDRLISKGEGRSPMKELDSLVTITNIMHASIIMHGRRQSVL